MNGNDVSPKQRLFTYLDLFSRGEMDVESFAGSFEHVYNLELDKSELGSVESKALASVFEKVAWFSPFEEERQQIPNYVGPGELLSVVKKAQAMLGKDVSG